MPGDSVLMRAVFECDSTNNVLLTSLEETKTKQSTAFKFRDGVLDYRVMKPPDTVWLPTDSVIINKEIPIIVEVPKIEYRQTKWQRMRATIGDIAIVVVGLTAIWVVIKKNLKIF